jgi:hypothetical protein
VGMVLSGGNGNNDIRFLCSSWQHTVCGRCISYITFVRFLSCRRAGKECLEIAVHEEGLSKKRILLDAFHQHS